MRKMAIIRKNELKQMSKDQMNKKLEELRLELMRLRSQSKAGTVQNPGRIGVIKRTIAMILTKIKMEQGVRGKA